MKKSFSTWLLSICCVFGVFGQNDISKTSIQTQQSQVQNLDLLSNWTTGSTPYNDVWGYVDSNGDEVAIIGSRSHYYFVDISDPVNPELINGFEGGNVTIWRDMKTYGQWAYGVCDSCNEGLSIFKLGDSPKSNGVQFVRQTTGFFSRAHNIYIDEQHGRMYVIGSNTQRNGVIILDIATNPEDPILLGAIDVAGGYMHDLYVRNHIGYGNSEGRGLYVYNFSDPTSPQLLGTMTNYPQQGYNHSGWLNPAGDILIMADETHNTSLKAVDVSDLSDIEVTSLFRSELLAPAVTGSIAHNPFVRDNFAVVSYYHDGIQVFDISNPENVQQVAWYDTFPTNTSYGGFSGCWGAYPFLPSGNILGSDGTNGLFVLRPTQFSFAPIPPVQAPFANLNESIENCVSPGTAVSLSLTTDAHTIQWFRNGALVGVGDTFTASSEGTYTATVFKGPHSLSIDPIEIVYGTAPVVEEMFPSANIVLCGENGASDLLVITDIGDSYTWFQDGVELPEFSDSNGAFADEAGVYTVVISANGCETIAEFNLTRQENPIAEIDFSSTQTLCEGESITLESAEEGDSYSWARMSFNSFTTIPGETNRTLTVNEPGVYLLGVTVGDCSANSEEVRIEFEANPEAVINQGTEITVCEGETFTLSSESEGDSFQWFTSAGDFLADGNTIQLTQSGSYQLIVTQNGCTTISEVIDVIGEEAPEIVFDDSQGFTFCEGETFTLSVLTEGESYSFDTSGAGSQGPGMNNSFELGEPATVVVVVRTEFCFAFADIEITQVPNPESIIAVDGASTICEGESVSLSATNLSDTYQWFLDGQAIQGANSANLNATENGTYTLELSNDFCSDLSEPFALELESPPTITLGSEPEVTICEGESTTLVLEGQADSYEWLAPSGQLLSNTTTLTVLEPGIYTGYGANGDCLSEFINVTVEVLSPVNLEVQVTDDVICDGESTVLTAITDTDDFVWIRNGQVIEQAQTLLEVNEPGVYSIETSAAQCFSDSPDIVISQGQAANAAITPLTDTELCQGETGVLQLPTGFSEYVWSLNGATLPETSNRLEIREPGNYIGEVISVDGCRATSEPFTLIFNPLPDATLDLENTISICSDEIQILEAPQEADTYTWSLNGQVISNEPSITATQSGVYQLELIENNCASLSQEITLNVTENPTPELNVTGQIDICEGEEFRLMTTNNFGDYQWFRNGNLINDANVNFIDISEPGAYFVEAVAESCSGISNEVSIELIDLPVASIEGEEVRNLCVGGTLTLVSEFEADEYIWSLDVDPAFSASGSSVEVSEPGIITLTTIVNGCESLPTTVAVSITELPDIGALSEDFTICEGESNIIEAPEGAESYTWFRNGEVISQGNATLNIDMPGIYSLEIQSDDCFETSNEFTVELIEIPVVDDGTTTDIDLCLGDRAQLVSDVEADQVDWFQDGQFIFTGPSIFIIDAGIYYFEYNIGSCSSRSPDFVVSLTEIPAIDNFPDLIEFCDGESSTLSAPDGLDSYTWFRNEVMISTEQELIITEPGEYQLRVVLDDCFTISNIIEARIIDLPSLASLPVLTSICAGSEFVFEAPVGLDTYTWFRDGEIIPDANSNQLTVSEAGTYTLEVSLNSCSTRSQDLLVETIFVPAIDQEIDLLIPEIICGGQSVIFSVIINGFDSLTLLRDGGIEVLTTTTGEIVFTESGLYTIVASLDGCSTTSREFEVSFVDNPVAQLVVTHYFICPGETANFEVIGDPNLIYQWRDQDNSIISTEMNLELAEPGFYTVEVIDGATGCNTILDAQVTVFEVIAPSIVADGPILTSTEAQSYQWLLDGQTISDATDIAYTALVSGIYQVEIIDANGCPALSEELEVIISSTTVIESIVATDLFPNPAQDHLTLSLTTRTDQELELEIFNQLGQSLWKQSIHQIGEKHYPIPVQLLVPGLYYLRLQNQDGQQQTMKFIKQ